MKRRRDVDKTFSIELNGSATELRAMAGLIRNVAARAAVASTWKTIDADAAGRLRLNLEAMKKALRGIPELAQLILNTQAPAGEKPSDDELADRGGDEGD